MPGYTIPYAEMAHRVDLLSRMVRVIATEASIIDDLADGPFKLGAELVWKNADNLENSLMYLLSEICKKIGK